jgi:hypothetical protein
VRTPSILAAFILAACSSASPAPKGWTPVAGSADAWSSGSGAGLQLYSFSRTSFSGSLQDLASQVTVDVITGRGGAKLVGSDPFAPCPGEAGLARFSLRSGRLLQVGFSVRDGSATRATYVRPVRARPDPNVARAMQNVLC